MGPYRLRGKYSIYRSRQYAIFPADDRFVLYGTNSLLVQPIKRSTVGSRALAVAGPKNWNALP